MEDSEQRKKRLKEMRMQADLVEVSGGVEASGSGTPGPLSNPLIEPSSTMLQWDKSNAAPRFDFYTDPMSAFNSNKKRSNAGSQVPPDYFTPNSCGSPMAQYSSLRPESMNPQMTSTPGQLPSVPNRNLVWNGSRGPAPNNFLSYPSSASRYPSTGFDSSGSPIFNSVQGTTYRPNHSPNYSPRYRNSPSPGSGRGRGSWYNSRSPGSGRGGGRGLSFRSHYSNADKPCDLSRFYKQSMVEDPWKFLKPVLWKVIDASLNTSHTPENINSWTPESSSTKLGESSAALVKSYSQPSLAEYLASAFNEAANTEENV